MDDAISKGALGAPPPATSQGSVAVPVQAPEPTSNTYVKPIASPNPKAPVPQAFNDITLK